MAPAHAHRRKLQPGSPQDPTLVRQVPLARADRARRHGRGLSRQGAQRGDRHGRTALLAIKCMRPQLAKEARFVEMFIREGKLAVLLDNDSHRAHLRDRPHRGALLHRHGVHRRQGSARRFSVAARSRTSASRCRTPATSRRA